MLEIGRLKQECMSKSCKAPSNVTDTGGTGILRAAPTAAKCCHDEPQCMRKAKPTVPMYLRSTKSTALTDSSPGQLHLIECTDFYGTWQISVHDRDCPRGAAVPNYGQLWIGTYLHILLISPRRPGFVARTRQTILLLVHVKNTGQGFD